MEVTVLLFAGVRQQIGRERVSVSLPQPCTVAQLREALALAHPQLAHGLAHCRVALDREFAFDADPVTPGQEVALIPPVSGGHDGIVDSQGQRARLSSEPLSLAAVVAAVEHPGAGGLTTFSGQIRDRSRGKEICRLEYEAYAPMAVAKMDEIALAVEAEIPGSRVALAHRVGRLEIGELAVVIAASAPHRAEAFDACREVIERLKRDVPIWKKEIDTSGAEWIGQGP